MFVCVFVCARVRVVCPACLYDTVYVHVVTIIIKRISGAPSYRTRWEHRALYNNSNNNSTHTRTHAHIHTHTHIRASDGGGGVGTAAKKSFKIVIEQVRLEGRDRIRVADCLGQIVPNRCASVRKRFSPNVFVFRRGVTKVRVCVCECVCE